MVAAKLRLKGRRRRGRKERKKVVQTRVDMQKSKFDMLLVIWSPSMHKFYPICPIFVTQNLTVHKSGPCNGPKHSADHIIPHRVSLLIIII